MPQAPLDPEIRDWLAASHALLERSSRSRLAVLFVLESIETVLLFTGRPDWKRETRFLRARLAEVERAT